VGFRGARRAARLTGSPVVQLNRGAALRKAGKVETALALWTVSAQELDSYHYLYATRAAYGHAHEQRLAELNSM
jgi:predicted RNA polymerase sigma factor